MASTKVIIPLLLLVLFNQETEAQELSIIKTIRECLKENTTVLCLKERALKIVDEAVISDQPIPVNDYIDIVRDTSYEVNLTSAEDLPRDLKERSETLNQLLLKRVDDFFESRSMKLKMKKIMQGRAKGGGGGGNKGGKKGGGMMLLGGLAMAGMMAQLFMGKVAFMAGAALMISKMALLLSSVVGLKKLVSGSGGSDNHVVVASGGEHGGWHRSLIPEDEAAIIAYRAQVHNQENSFF